MILQHVTAGEWSWVGSAVLDFEVADQRIANVTAASTPCYEPLPDWCNWSRKRWFAATSGEALGFADFDALHLACAERAGDGT